MCIAVKYGAWNIAQPEMAAVNALVGAGYSPLSAMVLASRNISTPAEAKRYLDRDVPLLDPFLMTDMKAAAQRVGLALSRGEKIAVFGDYDVDGITATCLLTDYLRRSGGNVVSYIPSRLEEGYGLNPIALHHLVQQGVKLIVTVDCGITALAEARLCRELGMELVITDHHECKESLPLAVAVVDPHRPDCRYPHQDLSGVGVAFKLAAALCGSQEKVLEEYADLVCLGTVADVMPLRGENRTFVSKGLEALRHTGRPGVAALMEEAGCDPDAITANSIGFMLAPRINAAGRMGQIDLAVELFLTEDPGRGAYLARGLCELNRQRQAVESDIYRQAISMLPLGQPPQAIVLADEQWHQGVVGIVASRIAEEFSCPTFLVCLDGEHGKASSRSYGGFNLFASLGKLSNLLESYGGHELAAGFTIARGNIPAFREQICALARDFYSDSVPRTVLEADCVVTPELLSVRGIDSLDILEPCGTGCPRPVLVMQQLTIDRITMVGSGRHMRLRLRRGYHVLNAIYFSANPEMASIQPGDLVDVAFTPQVNEFRGERTAQMNVLDIRPSCNAECCPDLGDYRAMQRGLLTAEIAGELLPQRAMLATVWRYLASVGPTVREAPLCLCRKIVRYSNTPMSLGQLLTCLDIFRDVGLLETRLMRNYMDIRLTPGTVKADLTRSQTMQRLLQAKES